jgi:hypothetical protein
MAKSNSDNPPDPAALVDEKKPSTAALVEDLRLHAADGSYAAMLSDIADLIEAQAAEIAELKESAALLNDDEWAWVKSADDGRCGACGHLAIFHNTHCCDFCMVEAEPYPKNCRCEDWHIPEARDEQ